MWVYQILTNNTLNEGQVFAPDIGIEDDMSVMVKYNTGATLTYHLVRIFSIIVG